jgi:sugar lactone lactonase YvrE
VVTALKVSHPTGTSVTLEAMVDNKEAKTTFHFEYGPPSCTTACTKTANQSIPAGASAVPVSAPVSGLSPVTVYHFRLVANNGATTTSSFQLFATRGEGTPVQGLPDNRSYEQASPVNKDGGDATGKVGLVKAADDGNAVTFNSTFGIPGGKGAQALPTYLATRAADWSTQGLLPPPVFGERAQVQGWLPDFSETFSNATQLSNPRIKALISQSTIGGPARTISPYVANPEYSFVGTDADNSTVFFEAVVKLPPEEGKEPIAEAIEGKSNVYAWDRATGEISLASVYNTAEAPLLGSFAGPYGWSAGTNASSLRYGGAARNYYLQGTHAITASGGIYFTEAGTGQLFFRLNPTRPQSSVVAGKCTKPEDACTLHVSASKRTPLDAAGAQPAAFLAATEDGSEAFFTSAEKLTEDANTGPEQPKPAIGTGNPATGTIEDGSFIPKRAVGVTVDGEYVYWADPTGGAIGRAKLDGSNVEEAFIAPGETECEEEVELNPEEEPGVKTKEKVKAPSTPRYLATDSKYIYWTNAGVRDAEGNPKDGGGTIGRAELDGSEASIDPEFICGAANPQGIAVNASEIYWANAAKDPTRHALGRATIEGGEVNQKFFSPGEIPFGVALDGSHVYFDINNGNGTGSSVSRIPLKGGTEEFFDVANASGLRGIALDGTYVYWAAQSKHAIGRIPIADFPALGACSAVPTCEREFVKEIGGDLNGLAVDASHLYWSVNGDAGTNPGNDLYAYRPAGEGLEDLTPDSSSENGAEVQGLLGSSANGSYLYFVANGDLDGTGEAEAGDCHASQPHGSISTVSGSCNLYLRHEGKTSLVSAINGRDSLDWTGTAEEIFGGAFDISKTAFLGDGGKVLLFRSVENLTSYDNEGKPELYRYSAEDGSLRCASCPTSGAKAGKGAVTDSIQYPGPLSAPVESVAVTESRNLSADGNRAFFETAEALVPEDTNGDAGCPGIGSRLTPACQDVYEWEAPEEGSCSKGAAAFSVLNEGCVYLISTGKSPYPSYFADASETGKDVFFFTRQRLVGQDTDELQDVYDARVEGGLASQNPPPPNPCLSAEACHGPAQAPPAGSSEGSATFVGPANPKPKHPKPKTKKKKKAQHKKNHHKKGKKQQRAGAKGRQGR